MRAFATVGLIAGTLVGCSASDLDWRYPSKLPARADDIEECNAIAKPGIHQRGSTYAGCMLAKGHQVRMGIDDRDPLGTGSGVPVIWVEATRPHEVDEAARDVMECRRAAQAAISGYATASMVSAIDTWPTLEAGFAQCMEPRGYRWSRWVPER
jgi:hypothetical protein